VGGCDDGQNVSPYRSAGKTLTASTVPPDCAPLGDIISSGMRLTLAIPMAVALLASACGPDLAYQRAPSVTIPAGATWTWSLPDGDGVLPHDGGVTPDDSIARFIASAIEQELTSAGYPRTGIDSAQFVVHYHVAKRTVSDTIPRRDLPQAGTSPGRTIGTWSGYGRPEELDASVITWEEGMLVVDFLPKDRSVVAWRGMIAGEINSAAARQAAPAIREAIRRLMKGFP
jgi:hypothetical protein